MKKTRSFGKISTLTFMLAIFAAFVFFGAKKADFNVEEGVVGSLYGAMDTTVPEVVVNPPTDVVNNSGELSDAADVVFSAGKSSEYVIIFSSAGGFANDLSNLFYKNGKALVDFYKDTDKKESAKEIIIGLTNRQGSESFVDVVLASSAEGENYAWGYKVEFGKLLVYASSNASFSFLLEDLASLFTASGLTLKEGLYVVRTKNIAEHKAEQDAIAEAEKQKERIERYNKAIEALAAFKGSSIFRTDSSGVVQPGAEMMPSDAYPDPEQYPNYGEHPRVYVNSETLPRLREVFNNPPEDCAQLVDKVKEYADYDFNGVFPEIHGKTYTYQEKYFKYMEAKAFMYLMTGDEVYGYEAILCAKNCILTMLYTEEIFKDTYRGGNHAITVITEIYDWCYDLLTEEDKTQIIDGCRFYLFSTLEFSYPPSNMGYISGHGMSYQFLHAYLGFSLAIYDERPDWWDFVGGRFYSQYCLGINYCVQSGYYSQGTTCYAPGKLYNIYISSWIVQSATGKYPYNDGLRDVPYFMLSQIMPNDRYFEYGDSPTSGYGASVDSSWMIIAVGMYNDPTVYAAAKKFSNNFTKIEENTFGSRITAPYALIFLAGCAGSTEQYAENLPLIEYTGSPAGITVARESWNDANAATVFMKIGELNMANHDHRDSGTFQIYYKGLLAPANGGEYAVYGSHHWKYYHQATISDNGLLVFDPDLYEEAITTPMLDEYGNQKYDKYGTPMVTVTNPQKAFYTGSQRAIGEAGSFDTLLGPNHNFGTVVGHAEGYTQDGEVKFAYLAGDITNAYTAGSASYVGRSMLTVFTGDPDYPMYFFVYDNVAPVPGDDDVKMTFLLHSVTEPIVDGSSVIIENGEGQLVLLNTTGNDIETIGGDGKKYWVNGINLYEDVASGGLSTGTQKTYESTALWGRTEVTAPVGESGNKMLNVMYVADKGQKEMLSASSVISENLTGTVIGNVAVFFADTSVELFSSAESVTVENESEIVEYYFCGLEAGSWKVFVGEGEDKQFIGTTYSTDATHMVSFKAPRGTLTIEPGDDIKPSNSGRIFYQNVSGTVDGPKYYSYDGITTLPTNVSDGSSVFLGWYLDAEFTKPIKEIDGSLYTGNITVFAKFKFLYSNEDYSWAKETPFDGTNLSKNGIIYNNGEDKTVNYKTGYEGGESFIVWTGSTGGPIIGVSNAQNSIANSTSYRFTYTFSLAKNGTDPLLATSARIVSRAGKTNNTLGLFSTSTNGNLTVCGKTIPLSNDFFTFSVEVDFAEGKITAYDELGELIGQREMTLIESAATLEESKSLFVDNILNWRNNGGGGQLATIRIGQIKIEAGGFITEPDECLHKDVNDDGKCDRCKSDFDDGCEHFDANDDGKCDKCSENYDDGCDHKDKDDNGECDKCSASFDDGCEICRDEDDDKKCDRCQKGCDDGCDNHRDKNDDGKCDVVGCGKEYDDGCDHYDRDDDGKCDKCDEEHEDGCENCRDANDDGKCDRCGEAFDDGEELPDGQWRIVYVLPEGVTLPVDAPQIHTKGKRTVLLAKFDRVGYIFAGWYLDEACTEPVDCFEKDFEGDVTLYPKWNKVIIDEDYAFAETEQIDKTTFAKNGITYQADVNYKTYFEDGKGYVVWTAASGKGSVLLANVVKTNSNKLTYTFSFAKVDGYDLLDINFRLIGRDPDATANKELATFFSLRSGKLNLCGKSYDITEELFTFSITIDFESAVYYSYDESGNLLSTANMPNAPVSNAIDTWLEWKDHLTVGFNARNQNSSGADQALKIGYIGITEGGYDEKYVQNIPSELPDGAYRINYQLNGGALPEGSPDRFMAGVEALLPETVYYADPNVKFVGWYADSTFTEPITKIPADAPSSDFTVYAKTVQALYLIDVNFVDAQTTGTVVANRYCVHEGGDTDADGICNVCGFCAGHTDTASDGFCDVCGYKIAKCSSHSDVHTKDGAGRLVEENVADKYCDICGRCPTNGKTYDSGKLGNSLLLQDCDQPYGYATIVDNGDDDYLHIEGNYSGTLLQLSGAPDVKNVLASTPEKALTFRMVYGCYGDTLVSFVSRMTFRKADDTGNVAEALITLGSSDGRLILKSRGGAVLASFDYGTLIDVSFVVDFDNRQIRYYLGDSYEPVLTEVFAPEYTRGLNILNSRLSGTGSVDISAIEIYVGDKYN